METRSPHRHADRPADEQRGIGRRVGDEERRPQRRSRWWRDAEFMRWVNAAVHADADDRD